MTRYAVRALCHRPTTERIQFIIKNDVHYDMCARADAARSLRFNFIRQIFLLHRRHRRHRRSGHRILRDA